MDKQRARLSIDVSYEMRRKIRLAAAICDDSICNYVLEAVQERLARDLNRTGIDELLTLTANGDPVLAELWDNDKDSAYDKL